MKSAATGMLHHLGHWVPDLSRAEHARGWLLDSPGYELYQQWPEGASWRCGDLYIVLEQSPARSAFRHDRHRPGLNHLAFHVSDRATVDRMVGEALLHGWRLLFADRHPYAGGEHTAAYLKTVTATRSNWSPRRRDTGRPPPRRAPRRPGRGRQRVDPADGGPSSARRIRRRPGSATRSGCFE
jgi:catechol 2,3-dioxygenase-like lactoylglutathione lyase family enzyme